MKTWKQKVGKRLMKHVIEETYSALLREVKENIQYQIDSEFHCYECAEIAQRLGIPYSKEPK